MNIRKSRVTHPTEKKIEAALDMLDAYSVLLGKDVVATNIQEENYLQSLKTIVQAREDYRALILDLTDALTEANMFIDLLERERF